MWARRDEAARAQIPLTDAYWRERAIPELRAHYGWVAAVPVETMPADELAAAWDEAWARIGRCWSIHFYAIRGPYQVLEDLADLYESVVEDASPGEALGLIGGGVHELHDVERQLEALAALVAATPEARRSLPAARRDRLGARHAPGGGGARDGARCVPGRARPSRTGLRRPRHAVVGRGPRPAPDRARQTGRIPASGRRRGTSRTAGGRGRGPGDRRPGAAGRRSSAARPLRGAPRVRAPDRPADRDPQLLDRPDGAVVPAPLRHAGRRPARRGRRDRPARRRVLSATRRDPGAAPATRGSPAGRRRPPRGAGPLGGDPAAPQDRGAIGGRRATTASTASGSSRPSRTSCAAPAPPPGSSADPPG